MAWFKKNDKETTKPAKKPPPGRIIDSVTPRPATTTRAATEHGSAQKTGRELNQAEKLQNKQASEQRFAHFGQIVTVLMRSSKFAPLALADLKGLAVPPLLAGQYAVGTAQSKANGTIAPVALVLWARVSKEVDARLCKTPARPIKLEPHEWKSGDEPWVVAAIGNKRMIENILRRLYNSEWGKKPAKILGQAKDGTPVIITIKISSKVA